jgi:AraC family transcriptional regulator
VGWIGMFAQEVFGERYEARIARAIAHVDEHPAEPVNLETLASIACLSPFHFHRVFRSLTGTNVRGFVERRKLEQAVRLAGKGQTWKQASAACGFGSPITFTRAFKRVFGVPPSEFDHEAWWRQRDDRDDALNLSSHILRPPPLLDPAFKVSLIERLVAGYNRLRDWAARAGVNAQGGAISGASRDDPDLTPLSRCRYDFQIELPEGLVPPTQFSVARRKAGLWAVAPIAGSLEVVDRAWAMLFKSWLPASGLDLRDEPAEEVYCKLPEEIGWSAFDLWCCVPVARQTD